MSAPGRGWRALIDAAGAEVLLDEAFLSPADAAAALRALLAEVPFSRKEIVLFGKRIEQPRLVSWHGDPGTAYRYSGVLNEPLPWTPALARLRDLVAARAGHAFNSVLANLYRDGRDSMGYHADAEPELGPEPVIASLSLGATRRFVLAPKRGGAAARRAGRIVVPLAPGSLLLMRGATQALYRHGVPKEAGVTGARINLTFRRIFAGLR